MGTPTAAWRAARVALVTVILAFASIADAREEEPAAREDAAHCLALAMYWEAKGEGRGGMLAVGSVVLNRVENPNHPDSVCGVVKEGGEAPPCAFSFWCDGRPDDPVEEEPWAMAQELAGQLLTRRPPDPTEGAILFHRHAVSPDWAAEFEVTARIGNHVFYR